MASGVGKVFGGDNRVEEQQQESFEPSPSRLLSSLGVFAEHEDTVDNLFRRKPKDVKISVISPVRIKVYSPPIAGATSNMENPLVGQVTGTDENESRYVGQSAGLNDGSFGEINAGPTYPADFRIKTAVERLRSQVDCMVQEGPERNQELQLQPMDNGGQTYSDGNSETNFSTVDHPSMEDLSQNSAGSVRRSMTGASAVNNARLLALIRRFRGRRFRTSRPGMVVRILRCFLSFLYFVGMSPIRPACAKNLPKWIVRFQTVAFWLVSVLSVLQALDMVKYMLIQFRVDETLLNFLTTGFFAIDTFTRMYYIKLLATSAHSIDSLLEKIDKTKRAEERNTGSGGKLMAVALGIGILSIFITGIDTVFGEISLKEWSWEKVKNDRSLDFAETIFVWTSANYTDTFGKLEDLYGVNITMQTELFAYAGTTLNFWGTLHSCLLLDLWLIVSIEIYTLQLQLSLALADAKGSNEGCPVSVLWQHFTLLRDTSEHCNDLFGNLFKMVHLQNCLLFGYFLFETLKSSSITASNLVSLFSVVKISVVYYLLQKSSRLVRKRKH